MKVTFEEILDQREKSPSLEQKMLHLLEEAILKIEDIEKSHSMGEIDEDAYFSLMKKATVKLEMVQLEIMEYDEFNDTNLIPPPYNKVKINDTVYNLSAVDSHFIFEH